jgi:hypothetical protein
MNRLTSGQHGLVTLAQLVEAGYGEPTIRRMLRSALLEPVHAGVFRLAGSVRSHDQRLLAAVMAAGPGSAVSHRAAAAVHGLWTLPRALVEITVARPTSPDLGEVIAHRLADLHPRWVVSVRGIPVTTPARCLVDLGAVMTFREVSIVAERAFGRRVVTRSELAAGIDAVARRGRAGVGIARRLLDSGFSVLETPSVLQARLSGVLGRYGVPLPIAEHAVYDGQGAFVGRVDFAYPEIRFAIETDGFEAHSTRRAFDHDRARQNDLVDLGWTVHRYTHAHLSRPRLVAARIDRTRRRLLGSISVA